MWARSIVFCGQIRDVIRETSWRELKALGSSASMRAAVECDRQTDM